MGLPILGLGLWYALARGRRPAGFVIALAGLAWSFVAVYVVVGHFRRGGSMYYGFYDEIGGSPQGVVRMLFSDPGAVLGALFEGHDIVYLVLLGSPLLFLFLLSPALAAVALPQLLANGLSDFRSMTDPRYHCVGCGDPVPRSPPRSSGSRGFRRRRRAARGRRRSRVLSRDDRRARPLGAARRRDAARRPRGRRRRDRAAALAEAVALVPAGAPVTASNTVGSHLSARRYIYSVPLLRRADVGRVDRADPWVVTPRLADPHPASRAGAGLRDPARGGSRVGDGLRSLGRPRDAARRSRLLAPTNRPRDHREIVVAIEHACPGSSRKSAVCDRALLVDDDDAIAVRE